MTEKEINQSSGDHFYPTEENSHLDMLHVVSPPSTLQSLRRLRSSNGEGILTSEGANYNNAIFGRDSLIASSELLGWDPEITHEVILTLASLQGTRDRDLSDEEPGRIHHENRDFSTWEASPVKKATLKAMSVLWGGNFEEMTTYFSLDSTPRFILLIADYAKLHPEILDEKIIRSNGLEITVEQSMVEATQWIEGHIAESGLVEVRRHNPLGLMHQTWKDSPTGYIENGGGMANIAEPIAYLGIQALAVDSLVAAAGLETGNRQDDANRWQATAESIVRTTIDKFWMEDEQYFGAAIEKDSNGEERLLKTLQSDAGWMLNSDFFDSLPESQRQKYVTAITKQLFSDEFLTDAGIRCRALKHADELAVVDYHGSLVTWPIDTYMVAQGLRKQGMSKLADQLESRILNAVNMAGDCYEFFYVEPDGKVLLDPTANKDDRDQAEDVPIQMLPDSNIAWTVAAVFMIKLRHGNKHKSQELPKASSWAAQLESEILSDIKDVSVVTTINELSKQHPEQPVVRLDTNKGNFELARILIPKLLGQFLHRNKK